MAKRMACALLFFLATAILGTEAIIPTAKKLHTTNKDADNMLKIITELLAREDFYEMLQPYIDDDFEKLEADVINRLNADKLNAISQLKRSPPAAFLIAKAELLHQFREGVVHMETAYTEFYQLFQRGMDIALKKGEKPAITKVAKKNPRLPKKSLVARPNPHAHQERVDNVVRNINLFTKRYTDEFSKIRKQWFGNA